MVLDVVRRFAVRDLPEDLALVEIDRGDLPVRRLAERQALGRSEPPPPSAARAAAAAARLPAPARPTRPPPAEDPLPPVEPRARNRVAGDVAMSENPARRRHESHACRWRPWKTRTRCASRDRRSRPASSCRRRPASAAPSGPSSLLTTGGVNSGPILYFFDQLDRFGAQLRREVDQVVDRHALRSYGGGLVGKRLRRRIPLAGHVAFRHRALLDRPDRLARHAIEARRGTPAWSAARPP